MENANYTDYVENCIKDIEKRSNEIVDRTLTVQSELVRLVKERHSRDRSVIEDRFRSGVRSQGNKTLPAIFRPGSSNLNGIREIFGDILLSYDNGNISLRTIRSFECDEISSASFIIPSSNSKVWICDDSCSFVLMNSLGYIEKSLNTDFPIEHAALQGNEFIATSTEWLSVKRLRENGTIKTAMSTSPLFPLGVHVTNEGDILVCLVDKYDFSITTKSRRLIMIYHHIGLIPTSVEYERGNRIFTIPTRVTSCRKNTCIIAIDVQSKNKSRIICLSRDSKVVFEFSRQATKQFCPSDVCTSSNEEIFVLDEATQMIFVLNIDGLLISTVRLSDFCISQPTAMTFDCFSNRLWIAHSVNKFSVFAVGDVNEGQSESVGKENEETVNERTEHTWF